MNDYRDGKERGRVERMKPNEHVDLVQTATQVVCLKITEIDFSSQRTLRNLSMVAFAGGFSQDSFKRDPKICCRWIWFLIVNWWDTEI